MISERTQKGIEAQLKAEERANELGYIVSKPTTDCSRYDMIIDDGNCLRRIQVKYCGSKQSCASGSVELRLRKCYINKKERSFYTSKEIDAVVVYVAPIKRLCYLPISIVDGKKSITLRYENSKNNQKAGIIACEDYLW